MDELVHAGVYARIFDHLSPAAGAFPLGKCVKRLRIDQHGLGLREDAHQVFAGRKIHGGFAAYARIDHCEERSRDLHAVDAAHPKRGSQTGEVADHAASERNHRRASREPERSKGFKRADEFSGRFGRFAGRNHVNAGTLWAECICRRAGIKRRNVGV